LTIICGSERTEKKKRGGKKRTTKRKNYRDPMMSEKKEKNKRYAMMLGDELCSLLPTPTTTAEVRRTRDIIHPIKSLYVSRP
jgi:hypothetical protein